MKNECNGWSNRATWNINLTYQDFFNEMCANDAPYDDVDHLADAFKSGVEVCEEEALENLHPCSIVAIAFEEYMSQVNWKEIAESYAHDYPECIVKEEAEVE